MKSRFTPWFLGMMVVVAIAALTGSISLGSNGEGSDVVMLRCNTGSSFGVKAYKGSSNSPAKRADNCPEVLSLLLKEGFTVQSSGYPDSADRDFVVFTLTR